MDQERLSFLIEQYSNNRLTKQEMDELQERLAQTSEDGSLKALIAQKLQEGEGQAMDTTWLDQFEIKVWENIKKQSSKPRSRTFFHTWRAVAALLALGLLVSVLYWIVQARRPSLHNNRSLVLNTETIRPGSHRATLTLANGQTIALSSTQSGIVTGKEIIYLDGSTVVDTRQNGQQPDGDWLSLTTPKGGTYQVTLPDGTQVWLNAASTLTYPNHFDSDQRTVKLQGEAYFEVTHHANQPFIVNTGEETLMVLGTSFNISAYANEPTITTLVTGKVQLNRADQQAMLRPNQQAQWIKHSFAVSTVDIEPAIAWKKGWFIFHNEPLTSILQQLERWYAIDVDYTHVPDRKYYGEISRNVPLSAVLEMISADKSVQFEWKGGVLSVK